MQCPGCRFENMPGVANCGRCGAHLHVATMAVGIHPPRASARAKRWRRVLPTLHGGGERLAEGTRNVFAAIVRNWDVADGPASPLLLRMIIPGWPQIYSGRIARGRTLLLLWLVLLCSGAALFGTQRGGVLLGLALSCHATSVLDVVLNGYDRWLDRVRIACVTLVLIVLLVYLPVGVMFDQVASPQLIGQNSGPLQRGDVLLVNQLAYRWSSPSAGEVVVYDLPDTMVPGANIRVAAGRRVDRILATAGQHVTSDAGRIQIDGQPARWEPLNPELACTFEVTVPPDHCLILPSTDQNISAVVIPSVYLVPHSMLRGRVYLRLHPWSRFQTF